MSQKSTNIFFHSHNVNREKREKAAGHKGMLVWCTGLSGSGKSTVANDLEEKLFELGIRTYILDGDNIRTGLNKDLGFGDDDRIENIRRIGEIAKLFVDAGVVVITAFISPFRSERKSVIENIGVENVLQVYVNAPIEVCEQRDVKGLYAKARAGEIKNFTGIDSPFESPENPDVEVNTDREDLATSTSKILEKLLPKIKLI